MRSDVTTMRSLAFAASLALALAASGCLVVDRKHLEEVLRDGGVQGDGQVSHPDAGGPRFDDQCGAENPRMLLTDTTQNIMIDTTGFSNANRQSCGGETPGNDVFIGVDVVAGAPWHFHLAAVSDGRNPMLYLTPPSCDSRTCTYVSSACAGEGDEHFAFIPNENGRWYLAIDDGVAGGGQYLLGAFRWNCGDGMKIHGEACDDGNHVDGDGCDSACRVERTEANPMEVEPNDNHLEANAIIMPASNQLTVVGNIAGPGACTYADVFAVSVPDQGDLEVHALNPDGTPCGARALTPYNLALEDASGGTVVTGMQDSSACSIISTTNLAAGTYFIRVAVPAETDSASNYRLQVTISP